MAMICGLSGHIRHMASVFPFQALTLLRYSVVFFIPEFGNYRLNKSLEFFIGRAQMSLKPSRVCWQ